MNRFIRWAVPASILLLASCSPELVAADDDNVISVIPGPTVLFQGDAGHGSGFYIGDGYFVTAAHVVVDGGNLQAVLEDGTKLDGKPVLVDQVNDLAIWKTSAAVPALVASIECTDPSIGDEVSMVGYPLILGETTTWGRVASKPATATKLADWRKVYFIQDAVAPGNSGGPVFNASGKVVGILVGMVATPMQISGEFAIVVPASTLCKALDLVGEVA
jgi:S1-C subfamily serine protease